MKHLLENVKTKDLIKKFGSAFDKENKATAVILAAGHGKRIKSNTSKMLHKIWEVPTVNRVCNAWIKALPDSNTIIVVGIKADEVIKSVGKIENTLFAYQEVQHGTGHALQIGLENVPRYYDGKVYVFPGDMGLIDTETILLFKSEFEKADADMMVLTGIYEGAIEENYYGRIVRVPVRPQGGKEKDVKELVPSSFGDQKLKYTGKVIEIIEFKDILSLDKKKAYVTKYKKKNFKFTQKELLGNREFNSGVYAFKAKPLFELIDKIGSNNVQNEVYLTDLIGMFNNSGYSVEAVSPKEQFVLMGFNNKSVLKEMDAIAQKLVYEKLKDIVLIEDPNDFFISEELVDKLLEQDKNGIILDIEIGKGVYIGQGVELGLNIKLCRNVRIEGKIIIGDNVFVDSGSRIFSKTKQINIGNNVSVKGTCIIRDSVIEDNCCIHHSILINKKVEKGSCVKFFQPEAQIKGSLTNL
ncbi:MAG: N-acetylglucosamine-1-phosphate uridyltransferase [Ignavibacteria bacterium]|nr:MAG: N-acetylglucosamine-1-phosphate uridyltransferase [Ignavibacteria bacterium]KAF0157795.1 MAG: N-acetylglucosamine-1-phosphate uridyltransferase [Ignavibacteria bacterium]